MLPHLPVVRDYGVVGSGASQPRFVMASNGSEYIIKGPSLVATHRYVAANEIVGAALADLLEIPVVDHRLVSLGGNLFFASARMSPATFSGMQRSDFDRASNKIVSYHISVLDVLICNVDRHAQNLLIRWVDPNDRSGPCVIVANDHSHCLVQPGQSASSLIALKGSFKNGIRWYIGLCEGIPFEKTDLLSESIRRAEALADSELSNLIESIPDELLPGPDKPAYTDLLVYRKTNLRQLFRDNRSCFSATRARRPMNTGHPTRSFDSIPTQLGTSCETSGS